MKILCIGDSLSLPGHLNLYEDTWIAKLKKKYSQIDFITYLQRAITTDVLVTLGGGAEGIDNMPAGADCLEFYLPDIVILQLGIVDCAPRLIYKNGLEAKLIKAFPSALRKKYIEVVKVFRKRAGSRADVPIEKFYQNLQNYFERCEKLNVKRVIPILICYPDEKMIKKNSTIEYAVTRYNKIYEEFSKKYGFIKLINPLDSRKYDFEIFEDGYHPNKRGNQLVFSEIANALDECLN